MSKTQTQTAREWQHVANIGKWNYSALVSFNQPGVQVLLADGTPFRSEPTQLVDDGVGWRLVCMAAGTSSEVETIEEISFRQVLELLHEAVVPPRAKSWFESHYTAYIKKLRNDPDTRDEYSDAVMDATQLMGSDWVMAHMPT